MANAGALEKFAADNGINFFLVGYVDLLGVVRSKLVPSAAIGEMQRVGQRFGPGGYFNWTAADPDVMAVPDARSAIKLPWTEGVAWVVSDLYMNGTPVEQSPRYVLRKQIEKAERQGFRMKTGVECEFFLLTNGVESEIADTRDVANKPEYDQGALMRHFAVISELLEHMETLGWKPYQAGQEGVYGQFEVNWEYDDCLATADKHTFFKFMAKSVAEKHGFRATFMPKPFVNKTGNGAHCHVSVWNPDGSSNLFYDANGELGLSELAYKFVASILENSEALVALLNPTVNSYKRIGGHSTASTVPRTVSYTGDNRTHLVRIPDKGRFELRLADGAVNPYLLQAAILASGLDGINKGLRAPNRCDWNGSLPPPANGPALRGLPSTLLEALQNLSRSETLKQALGEEFVNSYLEIQMKQWRLYTSHLSKWELDNTLDC